MLNFRVLVNTKFFLNTMSNRSTVLGVLNYYKLCMNEQRPHFHYTCWVFMISQTIWAINQLCIVGVWNDCKLYFLFFYTAYHHVDTFMPFSDSFGDSAKSKLDILLQQAVVESTS